MIVSSLGSALVFSDQANRLGRNVRGWYILPLRANPRIPEKPGRWGSPPNGPQVHDGSCLMARTPWLKPVPITSPSLPIRQDRLHTFTAQHRVDAVFD